MKIKRNSIYKLSVKYKRTQNFNIWRLVLKVSVQRTIVKYYLTKIEKNNNFTSNMLYLLVRSH